MPQSQKNPNIVHFIMESASEELHLILRGHLHIEAILNALIARSVTHRETLEEIRLSFFSKVKLLRALGRIDEGMEALLLDINSLRNKIAHQLHFKVKFSDVFGLVQIAAKAGVEFSDETIHADKKLSEEWYGTTGVLTEVISNTFQELIFRNEGMFTKDEISEFLG